MRAWMLKLGCGCLIAAGCLAALSLGRGQNPTAQQEPTFAPELNVPIKGGVEQRPVSDLDKLSAPRRSLYISGQRGAEWLQRANQPDGRFVNGLVPALRARLEGDHYLRQAGAAFALARAARFYKDERAAALARQAVLTLLLDTEKDPQNPTVRRTIFPPSAVNPLAAASLLVLAIHELPTPGDDLLANADELCNHIRQQLRPDGSVAACDPADEAKLSGEERDAVGHYSGLALSALMHSQQLRPAPWKLEAVRRARAYYQTAWRAEKRLSAVPAQTAAYAEAFALTREQAFADFVNEMNDWLCSLQYQQLDPRQVLWLGGFMSWADGKTLVVPPQIGSAAFAESLAEACRVARQSADVDRYQRYQQALELSLKFVTSLQYTEANSQHFADWYRRNVLGAFHASHQDGNLRIDYTQHAVCALVRYLECVPDQP